MYIGPKSRTERPRKTKIGTEVAHVTRDSESTFKVKRSKVNLQGAGAYCGGLVHSLYYNIVGTNARIKQNIWGTSILLSPPLHFCGGGPVPPTPQD